jgi:hypothetical protein
MKLNHPYVSPSAAVPNHGPDHARKDAQSGPRAPSRIFVYYWPLRFPDLHRIKNEICFFENPFTVDVSTVPDYLQLELIEMQCQTPLQYLFREKSLADFSVRFLSEFKGT